MNVTYGNQSAQRLQSGFKPNLKAVQTLQPRFSAESSSEVTTPISVRCPNIDKLDEATKPKALEVLNQLNQSLVKTKAVVLKTPDYDPNIYYPLQPHIMGIRNAIDELRSMTQATAETPLNLVLSKGSALENMCLLGLDLRQVALQAENGEKVSFKGTLVQWGRMHDADLSQIDPTGGKFYQVAYSPKTKFPAGFKPHKADMYIERDRLKKLFKPVGAFLDKYTQGPRTFIKKKMDALTAYVKKQFAKAPVKTESETKTEKSEPVKQAEVVVKTEPAVVETAKK